MSDDDDLFTAFAAAAEAKPAAPAPAPTPASPAESPKKKRARAKPKTKPDGAEGAVVIPAATPNAMAPQKKSAHLTLRLSPQIKNDLQKAAERRGMNVTTFLETLIQLAVEADRRAGLVP